MYLLTSEQYTKLKDRQRELAMSDDVFDVNAAHELLEVIESLSQDSI